MRKAIVALGVAALAAGPWLGPGPAGGPVGPARAFAQARPPASQPDPQIQERSARLAREIARCTCRDVVINADNEVRDSEVTTGDAKVKNRSLTYIAPGFDDKRVKVRQRARAETGDAIAGQVIGVVAPDGCSNILIRARNVVENSKVESGDAKAQNRSLVLYDPTVGIGDIDIKVSQKATARTGNAVAGQIIGAVGGGGGSGCGGVRVETYNDVRNTKVITGDAKAKNLSKILACPTDECRDLLLRYLQTVDTVQVCDESGCNDMTPEEFIRWLGLSTDGPPDEGDEVQEEEAPPVECPPVADEGLEEHGLEAGDEEVPAEGDGTGVEGSECAPSPGEEEDDPRRPRLRPLIQ